MNEASEKLMCPLCGVELEATMKQHWTEPTKLTLSLRAMNEHLLQALHGYWRWCAEGQPKHGDQYYYDDCHDFIEYDAKRKDYRYHIQTYNSPHGDTWVQGRFRVEGGRIIEVNE